MDEQSLSIPEEVFLDILPRVHDTAELKSILYVAYLVSREGRGAVPLSDLMKPAVLRSIVGGGSPTPAETRLREALERTVANGTLLRVTLRTDGGVIPYFMLATERNRGVLERMAWGDEPPEETALPATGEFVLHRPNVFAQYEHHIGPLTPLLAEQLRDAERSYPREWIEEAILAAVHYNKRNWRYIETILTRWEAAGGPDGVTRGRS